MQKQIEELKFDLEGKTFSYQEAEHLIKKDYFCKSINKKNEKILVTTDTRVFLLAPVDVESFLKKCVIKEKSVSIEKPNQLIRKRESFVPSENCATVSDGLKNMFDKIISKNPSEEDYKQAKAVCDIAGKLIDIEKVRLGYYNLNMK